MLLRLSDNGNSESNTVIGSLRIGLHGWSVKRRQRIVRGMQALTNHDNNGIITTADIVSEIEAAKLRGEVLTTVEAVARIYQRRFDKHESED